MIGPISAMSAERYTAKRIIIRLKHILPSVRKNDAFTYGETLARPLLGREARPGAATHERAGKGI